ncbi:ATP12 family protein [Sphingomonas sp.]|uniref:ATP12 family chaperone protein n=1 Tax=Sphingomonas sp. TaxID=28214 RepID=UPI00286BF2C0|nr:ATP12 family protein [Sphingomonas sp.]
MKRFWKVARTVPVGKGWGVELDSKPLRTPGRAMLAVPTEALGLAVAREWSNAETTIRPRAMPLTGLANAAIDRIEPDRATFAAHLGQYAQGDLACYRAEGPETLVGWQKDSWDALLAWARRRYDVDFSTTTGIVHVDQPQATVDRLAHAVGELDPFHLAGLSPLVTIGGSLIAALAVLESALTPEQAWHAVSIDERWQIEKWGSDAEAETALANRHSDFLAAARFLALLA